MILTEEEKRSHEFINKLESMKIGDRRTLSNEDFDRLKKLAGVKE